MTIGIIVCGHGHFATGITSTLELVAGEQEDYKAVDFDGSCDFGVLLKQAVEELNCEKLIFFTDILGGTPFRQASMIAAQRKNCEVVTGTTAQMLIEACLERDDYDNLSDSINTLIDSARQGITSFALQMSNNQNNQTDDDGI
ncbi:PTS galactosamine/N-acetylgalactosamine transporter subunit IIA [Pasteurella atlantica]|uniref:PTS galactosamine/N-acetylgalactosamine transporter subunit IIA n=4 Tax=Pasteurellaceae TaxID=712 RepID=A0AAJ6NC81_9PAST|nr:MULTISPECIES: PTS galactosamine/N-acetylgalactosamine transporter subunit IIA [Pasteurella]MBR0574409.1 PTS sugar transporter subunit IIA [Pasteurella atlantica]MDP8034174.1 PTS galactosamine/N-acetylgalactosamine transporter subunit IIA [Pasteurella atlantica]MDP8036047.1 PTS galactosamine/N-acetylgalactosamine transporter subunit IIA [Pasteurella atlantica]MDP8037997.1 PTS galactosamine/N-acetylgalactosamine transporter subunit IIA [Pasteurella atlantica]MDP8040313.1 PTS galactosamine/N-a